MEELLTPDEVSKVLKVSVHTLAAWRSKANANGPNWINVGGSVRYIKSELNAWISGRGRNGETST